MFKSAAISVLSLLALAGQSFAQTFTLGSVSYGTLPQQAVQAPAVPPAVNMAVYSTEEEFTFEDEAQAALNARVNALKAAGLTTLGGRVTEKGNDYSFVIDYLPTVKGGAALPPAVVVETYKNGASYWREQDAQEARKACEANFRAARLAVLGSYVYDAGTDSAFAVDFVQKDLLRPAQEYDVKFRKYSGGTYTFESEAEKAVQSWLGAFRQAGVAAIRGRAVPSGRDYAVEVEYVTKAGRAAPRPQYSVARYDARETFPFDSGAEKAGRAALPRFAAAGAPPLSSVVRPADRDYSYSVDFLVANSYQPGGAVPSVSVQTYQAQETFTFESEAKKALADKAAAFNAGGLPVVGSAVTGSLNDYTYVIDYVARAAAPGPVYPPPPPPQR